MRSFTVQFFETREGEVSCSITLPSGKTLKAEYPDDATVLAAELVLAQFSQAARTEVFTHD